jgi:D-alanyl-D-alanine carboxypeptidase
MWRRSGGIFDKQMEFVLLTAKLPRVPVLFLLALCMLAFSAMQSASWAANPVLVFDVRTGKAIVARDAGKPWHPASLTKIMTAYLTLQAIDQGKLSLGTKLKVSKTSSAPPPSKIGFKPGTKVSVDFALKALLAYSANDMAALLAEGVAGSQKDFARLMNATARQLGMTGSHFVNPHGLHDREQVTTARDMAILTQALLLRYPQARSYYSAPHVKVGKKRLRNRNYLLKIWDKADGLKTGFICPSGFNLVATANVGGRQVAAVVFGTRSGKARAHKAKVVMENAAGYQGSASLVSIQNQGGKPPNLRSRVCGGKGLRMVNASQFNGWGATFGKFKSAAEAEAVVNGMEAVRGAAMKGAVGGVVRIPFTKDYVPVSFAMSQNASQSLCRQVQAAGGACDVVSPATFASFADLAAREKGKGAKPAKPVKPAPTSSSSTNFTPRQFNSNRTERVPASSR